MTTNTAHPETLLTPAEIRRRAAAIRRNWSPETKASRRRIAKAFQQSLLFGCTRRVA